jgi:hypothetical protein
MNERINGVTNIISNKFNVRPGGWHEYIVTVGQQMVSNS